jgi:hypothetical protein
LTAASTSWPKSSPAWLMAFILASVQPSVNTRLVLRNWDSDHSSAIYDHSQIASPEFLCDSGRVGETNNIWLIFPKQVFGFGICRRVCRAVLEHAWGRQTIRARGVREVKLIEWKQHRYRLTRANRLVKLGQICCDIGTAVRQCLITIPWCIKLTWWNLGTGESEPYF